MLGIHGYWLFILTSVLLILAPGQDTMFIVGRSLTSGRRSGIAAALGVSVGCIFHTLAAALGLSAILATSAGAFTAVKLAGAAYLIYLGIKLLRAKAPREGSEGALDAAVVSGSTEPRSSFLQGILTNVLNPKVALFFLALLPQFIDPASTTKALAFLALGATFIAMGTVWCLILASGAARLRTFFLRKPNVRTLVDRTTGALFFLLGARLAWAK